ncbi:hypothetical protein BLA29_013829 [Euroglyphus maynei]|uniref:Cullin-5 n=1 Tax=Euroglyphus maynei TaxID=6958 RepID=A0A1Y3BVF5_EURMA|nr:hypothetical protein BLA29_013829 [Euroglyphus maynei]
MLLVDAERKNVHSDPQLIVGVKESCVNLCKYLPNRHYIYRNNFESVYLASIESFYQAKGQEYYNEHGVLNYMKWVDQKIKEEIDRANRYLEPHSLSKVIA